MPYATIERLGIAAALSSLVLAVPCLAQYREYYVRGRVLDTEKNPVPGVEIRLRDVSTSRSYDIKTDKQGAFKLAGLPHGVYEVTFVKGGYATKQDQWKLEAPQDSMQRVDIPEVVLATQSQVQNSQRLKEAESGVKEAAEKLQKRDPDGAIALLEGMLKNHPRDANALFLLGLGYVQKKMCREAIDAFTQVTELSPKFPGAYFELGVCYRQLGDLPKALESYDKNLGQDPANTHSAYNSGLILFETNRIDEALARFELALALKPADAEVLEMIGRCYIHRSKFAEAVEYLERARAANSDPAKIASLDELVRKVRAQTQ